MYSIPHIIVNPKPKSANSTEKWEYGVELRCIMLGIWLKIGTVKVATELKRELLFSCTFTYAAFRNTWYINR